MCVCCIIVLLGLGGWTLVDFGTYTTRYERKQFAKTFLPWVYMFVRTEHQAAYTAMFQTVREYAQQLFGLDLQLSFGSLDRSQAIANAFMEVWPKITLLNCFPHFVRKSRENRKFLSDNSFYETNILVNIQHLGDARSKKQFQALSTLFLKYWSEKGEGQYADWLSKYYLGTWGNWFYTAAAPGVTPSQNALESHHRAIKKSCVSSLRASSAVVLNDSIPKILLHQELQEVKFALRNFCEGMIGYIV